MLKRKLKYFFVTLIVSLLIILPAFILIGAYSVSNVMFVGESADDTVQIRPTAEDNKNILFIRSGEEAKFTLMRFDAFGARVVSLTFPNELIINSQNNALELLELGGPAMVTTELETLLEVDIDYYCMMDEDSLKIMTGAFRSATPSLNIIERVPVLEGEALDIPHALQLISENPNDELLRTVCYSLLLEANMEVMAAEIPLSVQNLEGNINSNIGAEGLYRLTKIFSLLPYENVNYYAATLSGEETENGVQINSSDLEKARELL